MQGVRDAEWAEDVFCAFELFYPRVVVEALLYQPDARKRQRIMTDWRKEEIVPGGNYARDTFVRLPKREYTEATEWLYP